VITIPFSEEEIKNILNNHLVAKRLKPRPELLWIPKLGLLAKVNVYVC
jgi:hypothetical protein